MPFLLSGKENIEGDPDPDPTNDLKQHSRSIAYVYVCTHGHALRNIYSQICPLAIQANHMQQCCWVHFAGKCHQVVLPVVAGGSNDDLNISILIVASFHSNVHSLSYLLLYCLFHPYILHMSMEARPHMKGFSSPVGFSFEML